MQVDKTGLVISLGRGADGPDPAPAVRPLRAGARPGKSALSDDHDHDDDGDDDGDDDLTSPTTMSMTMMI